MLLLKITRPMPYRTIFSETCRSQHSMIWNLIEFSNTNEFFHMFLSTSLAWKAQSLIQLVQSLSQQFLGFFFFFFASLKIWIWHEQTYPYPKFSSPGVIPHWFGVWAWATFSADLWPNVLGDKMGPMTNFTCQPTCTYFSIQILFRWNESNVHY